MCICKLYGVYDYGFCIRREGNILMVLQLLKWHLSVDAIRQLPIGLLRGYVVSVVVSIMLRLEIRQKSRTVKKTPIVAKGHRPPFFSYRTKLKNLQ